MIVSVLTKTTTTIGERISDSLSVTLLGMIAVFSVLAVIWLVLLLFKLFFYKKTDNLQLNYKKYNSLLF